MSIAAVDIWKLLAKSRLLTESQVRQHMGHFQQADAGSDPSDAKAVCRWLVSKRLITPYQAKVLLAGRPGPFFYDDYRVDDHVTKAPLKGCFRAVHPPTDHPVILKFFKSDQPDRDSIWQQLKATIQQMGDIDSPHLVRCYQALESGSQRLVVMQDAPGDTVDYRLEEAGRFPPDVACRLIQSAAQGLHQLHQAGLVHGNMRPGNLLLEPSGHLRLFRDPLSRPQPLDQLQKSAPQLLEMQADYLAPELATAGQQPSALSDIYALGCTFYQMLSGRPPFEGGDVPSRLKRHATEAIQPLDSFGVSSEIAQMVAYMMAKNPAVRYQQADVIANQLDSLLDSSGSPQPVVNVPESESRFLAALGHAPQGAPPIEAPQIDTRPSAPEIPPPAASPMDTAAIVVNEAASSVSANYRRKQHRSGSPATKIAVAVSGVLLLGLALILGLPRLLSDPGTADSDDPDTSSTETGSTQPRDDRSKSAQNLAPSSTELIEDDGRSLWQSPTSGQPLELDYVPPAARILLALRPADLLQDEEGVRVLQALGPEFATARSAWEQASGVQLEEIERLLIGFHDNQGKALRPSMVVHLATPHTETELKQRWKDVQPATDESGMQFFQRADGWSYYIPPAPDPDQRSIFVMGHADDVKEVIQSGGAPPLMRAGMRKLLERSDNQRHFSVFFIPNLLLNDEGKPLFTGARQKVIEPLTWLLGDDLQAAMLSVHLDQDLYLEVMIKGQLDRDAFALTKDFRQRLEQVQDQLANYVISLQSNPYWEKVRFRYGTWLRNLRLNTRVGVENQQMIANCWLPKPAAHNLIAGSELVISSEPGQVYQNVGPTQPTKTPQNLTELLDAKLDIDIPKNDLVLIVQDIQNSIAEEYPQLPFPLAIKLMGNDLREDGITQNQSVSNFSMAQKPIREILTSLVVRANPDGNSTGPSDPRNKLIWVIGPDPDDPSRKILLITTRRAAARESYRLPEVFRTAEDR